MQERLEEIKVSIGVPTYNRPNELLDTIRQIKHQTYQNLQIIICDNGGSITREAIELINNDPRFEVVINDTNIGLLRNTEKVVKLAKGKYFCWFSDDDWHSPDFITTLVTELVSVNGKQWAFSNYLERVADGHVKNPHRNKTSHSMRFMTSKIKFFRLLNFYLRDQSQGKCNAFYSVFRTDFVKNLNFEKLSSKYSNYSMDNLIVFEALKSSEALIVHDTLFSLKCDNVKHYRLKFGETLFSRASRYVNEIFNETRMLSILGGAFSFILAIWLLLVPKIIMNGSVRLVNNIRVRRTKRTKNWIQYKNMFKPSCSDRKKLNNVTLVCVATKDVERSLLALRHSQKSMQFADTILLSHYEPQYLNEARYIKIDKFNSVEEWGKFIIFELHKFVATDYALLIHDDGFIVNPQSWKEEFYDYDFIGSPWPVPKDPVSYRTPQGDLVRVGNSVSLRSKKILRLPSDLNLPWVPFHGYLHEDGFLSVQYKNKLEEHGIKFAEFATAAQFGREYCNTPDDPFIFHKWKGRNKLYPNYSDFE